MGRNRFESLALAIPPLAALLITSGCRVSLQLSPVASTTGTNSQEQLPSVSPQQAIIRSLVTALNQNRERGQFNNEIAVVTLPRAVRLGNAGGQRPVIAPLDFPDLDRGWPMRPILDVTKPIGPYKYFLRVYNPTTKKTMFWAVHLDPITRNYYYFTAGEFPNGWHSDFFLKDGKEINGDELFGPFLPPQDYIGREEE